MVSLSIVIPAYNESDRLPHTLDLIGTFFISANHTISLYEVIIVDDGSSDGTANLARSHTLPFPLSVISLAQNQGKGAATRRGVKEARGDYILMYDADAATPPQEIAKLVDRLQSAHADIAIGSRVLSDGEIVSMQRYRRLVGRVFHFLCAPLLPGIADASCGCKLFTKESAKKIFSMQEINRYAFDIEILMIALMLGYKIEEVPVQWVAVPESKVNLLSDGAEMAWCVAKFYWRKAIRSVTPN